MPCSDPEELSELYTDVMQQRMGSTTLTYRHEDGTNYCRILGEHAPFLLLCAPVPCLSKKPAERGTSRAGWGR